jgi:hypothetical protein
MKSILTLNSRLEALTTRDSLASRRWKTVSNARLRPWLISNAKSKKIARTTTPRR